MINLDYWMAVKDEEMTHTLYGQRVDPHAVAYRYGQRLFNFTDPLPQSRGLIIGEAPGPHGDPRLPLFPDPETSTAGRLRKYSGVTHAQWLGLLRRANLCREEPYDMRSARQAVELMRSWLATDGAGTRVLLLGRRVQEAWEIDHSDALFGMEVGMGGVLVAFIPHPSGLSYVYNDPSIRAKAGEYVRWAAGLKEEL